MLTYQNFLAAPNKEAFIAKAVEEYTASSLYKKAQEADAYYAGENSAILDFKSQLNVGNGRMIDLTAAIRTPSGIFKRLIVQLVQSIWAYGVQLDNEDEKKKLGRNFDKIAEGISKKAALHSVCYGFWNFDRLQRFTALEYFPLKDERTAQDMIGIRFWQIDEDKPMYIQLYEADGWTEYKRSKESPELTLVTDKQPYAPKIKRDALSTEVIGGESYGVLPIIPMYANEEKASELTAPIKSKIDLGDFILSGFGDDVVRTKIIYWILQGFGGDLEELLKIKKEIEDAGLFAPQDATAADAKLIDLPFAAVKYALELLEQRIYKDFGGFDSSSVSGTLTATEVKAIQDALEDKVSDFEWQAFQFVQKLLEIQGVVTENIRFKRKKLTNDMETMQMLTMCRADFDLQTALEKNPLVEPDEIPEILKRKAAEDLGAFDNEPDDTEDNPESKPSAEDE